MLERDDDRVTKDIGNLIKIYRSVGNSNDFDVCYIRERDIVPPEEAILCTCNCHGKVCGGVDNDFSEECFGCACDAGCDNCPWDSDGEYICDCPCTCGSNCFSIDVYNGYDTKYVKKIFRYGEDVMYLSDEFGWCCECEDGGTYFNLPEPRYVGTVIECHGTDEYSDKGEEFEPYEVYF